MGLRQEGRAVPFSSRIRTRTLHTVLPVCFYFATYYDMHLPFAIHLFTVLFMIYNFNRQHLFVHPNKANVTRDRGTGFGLGMIEL